jgi:hypothetical protein
MDTTHMVKSGAGRTGSMNTLVVLALVASQAAMMACGVRDRLGGREPMPWSAWVEDAAIQRGRVEPGDFGQFGCPPGWMAVDETTAALRGRQVSTTWVGSDPPQHDASLTCIAQKAFAITPSATSRTPPRTSPHRPLTPVSLSTDPDGITITFRREVARGAPIYIGQDTPCGPRVIGVRLGDLLQWLVDPQAAPKRDFLGMVSGGCPEQNWQ